MRLLDRLAILLVWLSALGWMACASQRYQDPDAGYSVVLPDDWSLRPPSQPSSVRLGAQSPPLEPGSPHRAHVAFAVDRADAPRDLETFTHRSFAIVTSRLRDVQVLESGRHEIAGLEAERVVYQYDDGNGGLTLLTYFVVAGQRGFVLSCGAASEVFDHAQPRCERVLRSFALID